MGGVIGSTISAVMSLLSNVLSVLMLEQLKRLRTHREGEQTNGGNLLLPKYAAQVTPRRSKCPTPEVAMQQEYVQYVQPRAPAAQGPGPIGTGPVG